jgi:predicted dehydrogenase
MPKHHILVIGSGSVGRRHARNFHHLGCVVSCMDLRRDRLDQVASEVPIKYGFSNLEECMEKATVFTGVAVCSPPKFHVAQTMRALDVGLPVFLEKPVSPDALSCRLLAQRLADGGKVLLGYTYRWWKPIRRLKSLIEAGVIGPLRHARIVMSAHLADWHPWERYQDFFMSSRDLGGGALLDESHFIDLMLWFFGLPERLFARVEKISDLEITSDDLVDVSMSYPMGFRATIHLDLFGRPHEKSIVIVGESGTLQCLFAPDEVRIGKTPEPNWEIEPFQVERNDMFLEADREFLDLASDRGQGLTCTVADGLKVLEVIEACRQSQNTGREVVLHGNTL